MNDCKREKTTSEPLTPIKITDVLPKKNQQADCKKEVPAADSEASRRSLHVSNKSQEYTSPSKERPQPS
jgi:hypothetical protein